MLEGRLFKSKTKIWLDEEASFTRPWLILGFPGLGRIGRICAKFLIKKYNMRMRGFIISPHFSSQVIITKDGLPRLMRAEIYHTTIGGREIVVLTGDEHYENIEEEYELASRILDIFLKFGLEMVITIGGHISDRKEKKVITFATDKESLQYALAAGAERAPEGTPVIGISGVMVNLSKERGIPAICLLGETDGVYPDVEASDRVLEVLHKILNVKYERGIMEEERRKIKEIVRKFEKEYEKIIESKRVKEGLGRERRGIDYVS